MFGYTPIETKLRNTFKFGNATRLHEDKKFVKIYELL